MAPPVEPSAGFADAASFTRFAIRASIMETKTVASRSSRGKI
jgi:hypothetical protein